MTEKEAYDERSRFVYHPDHRALVLLNYKCGFSTVSAALAVDQGWRVDLRNYRQLAEAVEANTFDGYDIHLLTRSPQDRIVSFYWNWFVTKGADFSGPRDPSNVHFDNLRRRGGEAVYQSFASASATERATSEFFDEYLKWLPTLWVDNQHTHPQHWAYMNAGIPLDAVTIWPMSGITELCTRLGAPTPQARNVSTDLDKQTLDTPTAREIVSMIYRRDYLEFGFDLPDPEA